MLKIGILICGHVRKEIVGKYGEYGGFFRRFLGEESFDFAEYMVVDNAFPETVDTCDAYVLSGSSHGAYEDHIFIPRLEDFIRNANARRVPLIGICFGHQIIAQALGGKVEKFSGGWGVGVHEYSMDLGMGPKIMSLNAMHQDQVVVKPAGARVIGTSGFCKNAALAYGDHIVTFQPHPEFDAPFMRDLIHYRRGTSFGESFADAALQGLVRPTSNSEIAHYVRLFLKNVCERRAAA